ncbi:MAG: sensor histidine kinase [Bryobacteraceae bacterium]
MLEETITRESRSFAALVERIPPSRALSSVRVLLGLTALAIGLSSAVNPVITSVLAGFVGFGIFAARKKNSHAGIFGVLSLFLDTLFFVVLAAGEVDPTLWFPSIYFLYVLCSAVALHRAKDVIGVVVISAAILLAMPGPELASLQRTAAIGGLFACVSAVQKRRLDHGIEGLRLDAEVARKQADKARDAERQRIADDFHDGPLQCLISFQMRLVVLRKLLERDRDAGMAELQQLQEISITQLRELRAFVRSMRPADDEGGSLTVSTRRLVDTFQKECGIPVTFIGGERPIEVAPEISADVLQMIREALNNVQKHSRATRVAVAFEKVGSNLEISVDDNGTGFHFSGTYTLDELELLRLGPVSLKRRARSLGGDVVLESRPGRGAGLKMRIPLPA